MSEIFAGIVMLIVASIFAHFGRRRHARNKTQEPHNALADSVAYAAMNREQAYLNYIRNLHDTLGIPKAESEHIIARLNELATLMETSPHA